MDRTLTAQLEDKEEGAEEEKEEEEDAAICQRCHRLRHYGVVEDGLRPGWSGHGELAPDHFAQLLRAVRNKKCVVVTLVDVFDFHGSLLPDLVSIVGPRNPLLVAVNKADLLPSDYRPDRVKQWALRECRDFAGLERLRLSDMYLVSARTGQGIGPLLDDARALAKDIGCDIYVVGAANVGKSSLLNRLANRDGGLAWGGASTSGSAKKNKGKGASRDGLGTTAAAAAKKKKKAQGITTSSLPGTTLDFLKLDVGGGVALYDTPGLILTHQLTARLNSDELKAVVPARKLEHVTLRVAQGKTVMLGGLARVEMLEGKPFFLTFFLAHPLKVHATKHQGPDAVAFTALNRGGLLTPPLDPERDLLAEPVEHDIEVSGRGWVEASCDVVLSGLGWFAVTGSGPCKLRVVAPKGVLVLQREPLMPFESRDSMAKATGGRVVKRGKAKKTRNPDSGGGGGGVKKGQGNKPRRSY